MLGSDFMQGDATGRAAVRREPLAQANAGFISRITLTPGVSAGISLAAAGDMALSKDGVLPVRQRLRDRLGIRREHLYGARQVHSHRVILVEEQQSPDVAAEEADGMVTASPRAVLSVTVADCLPIYLADRRTGAFGIVHSGWRGTGIVTDAVRLLVDRFGSRPGEIAAVIGPGIGACCYTVPPERAMLFTQRYGASVAAAGPNGPRLDLREANVVLLRQAGVTEVTVITDCTSCSDRLGSFRRQGPAAYTLRLAWIGRTEAMGGP
jgi:polyphenol oxidase